MNKNSVVRILDKKIIFFANFYLCMHVYIMLALKGTYILHRETYTYTYAINVIGSIIYIKAYRRNVQPYLELCKVQAKKSFKKSSLRCMLKDEMAIMMMVVIGGHFSQRGIQKVKIWRHRCIQRHSEYDQCREYKQFLATIITQSALHFNVLASL